MVIRYLVSSNVASSRALYIAMKEMQFRVQRTEVSVERMTHWNSSTFCPRKKYRSYGPKDYLTRYNLEYDIMMHDTRLGIDITALKQITFFGNGTQ